jgi:hypothetical protein
MPTPKTADLITVIRTIEDLRRALPSLLTAMPDEEAVALGHKLAGISKEAGEALEPIKGKLRELAVQARAGDPGAEHFDGNDGSRCTVSIPKPNTVVRKDADMDGLKGILGDDFDRFFDTVVTYKARDTLATRVAGADQAKRDAVLEAVDVKEGTPRVYFK